MVFEYYYLELFGFGLIKLGERQGFGREECSSLLGFAGGTKIKTLRNVEKKL